MTSHRKALLANLQAPLCVRAGLQVWRPLPRGCWRLYAAAVPGVSWLVGGSGLVLGVTTLVVTARQAAGVPAWLALADLAVVALAATGMLLERIGLGDALPRPSGAADAAGLYDFERLEAACIEQPWLIEFMEACGVDPASIVTWRRGTIGWLETALRQRAR